MKRSLIALAVICVIGTAQSGLAQKTNAKAEQPAAQAAPPTDKIVIPWTDEGQVVGLIKGYLERMKFQDTAENRNGLPVFDVPMPMTNANHHLRMVLDLKREILYVFLNRYLSVKADSPQLFPVLQRLMTENWNLNIGKFEWDKSDGEIRLSFAFSTENGVGYEALAAVLHTLAETGDQLWPELRKLTGQ